jgi:hypothetical protein
MRGIEEVRRQSVARLQWHLFLGLISIGEHRESISIIHTSLARETWLFHGRLFDLVVANALPSCSLTL